MANPISISLSGPSFSFLIYENSKCKVQQEGFLLGEIVKKETRTITDNDQEQVNVSEIVKINSVIPCPYSNYFYNGIGKVDKSKIEDLLGPEFDKVVGWYNYHKPSYLKLTMRQKIIHKQLQELVAVSPQIFTCCLLSADAAEKNSSTHMFQQIFVRRTILGYEQLPITIANLSEPNNTYKTSEQPSNTFTNILKDIKLNTKNTQGLVAINSIHSALQKHTDSVVEELAEAEAVMHQLECDVLELMDRIKLNRENCSTAATSNSASSSPTNVMKNLSIDEVKSPIDELITMEDGEKEDPTPVLAASPPQKTTPPKEKSPTTKEKSPAKERQVGKDKTPRKGTRMSNQETTTSPSVTTRSKRRS